MTEQDRSTSPLADIDIDQLNAIMAATEQKREELNAKQSAPPPPETPPESPFAIPEDQLERYSGTYYAYHKPPSYIYLLKNSLLLGCAGMIAGAAGSGKGMTAIQLSVSVAGGLNLWNTFETSTTGPVIYVSAEDDITTIHKRFFNVLDRLKSDPDNPISQQQVQQISANFYGFSFRGDAPLAYMEGPNVKLTEHWSAFKTNIFDAITKRAGMSPKLIIFDTLSRFLWSQNENDNNVYSHLIGTFDHLAETLGCTILFLHHTGKANGGDCVDDLNELSKALSQAAVRGASSMIASVRWLFLLAPMTADLAGKTIGAIAISRPDNNFLGARVGKLNAGPQGHRFYLQRVENGILERVDPDPDTIPKKGPKQKNDRSEDALAVLDYVNRQTLAGDPQVTKEEIKTKLGWSPRRTDNAVSTAKEQGYITATARTGKGGGEWLIIPEEKPQ